MSIRSIDRNATIAWSPLRGSNASLLAAGTIAGSFDIDFNVHNRLEIVDTSAAHGSEMIVKSELETSAGFTALAWSAASRPMGVIAGATTEGNVVLYDPAHFDKPDEAVITTVVKHSAAATCLDFCPSQQNLLVSGGADGELIVCDMNDPAKKTVHSLDSASESMASAVPGLGTNAGSGTQHPISSVAWNKKVGPILTAISNSGLITIWDLRKKSAILSFTDNGRRAKWRSASWDPSEPTLLVTAADEDENPVVLWDLRSIQLPRYFNGHKRGVWCTSWNQNDSSLLVTSGKDRTLCWNPSTMEIRCEIRTTAPQMPAPQMPTPANPFGGVGESQEYWDSSALWAPNMPGTLALCSYGSNKPKISLVPLSDPSPSVQPAPIAIAEKQPAALQPVPAWMKRPVGCAFGFGGKIAVFRKDAKTVELHKCDVDTALVERAERFRGATTSDGLFDFCQKKAAEAKTEEERDLWNMFSLHNGPNIRADLLKFLGYDKQKINEELDAALKKFEEEGKEVKKEAPAEPEKKDVEIKEETPEEEKKKEDEDQASEYFGDDQASVFDSIAAQKPVEQPKKEEEKPKKEEEEEEEIVLDASGDDAVITHALLVGEYDKAAHYCMSIGRDADALVIASYGGRELFENIRDDYCKRAWMPAGMKFVMMLLSNTLKSLVQRTAIAHWKAALAALCTYASKEELPILACQLGDRLREANNLTAATLCYITASNLGRVVSIWIAQQANSTEPVRETLPELIEKLIVLKHVAKASDDAFPDEALDRFVEYAELLSSQGAMLLAASYVSFLSLPRYANTPAAMFLERLRRSGDAPVSSPAFPSVGPSMPQQKQPQAQPQKTQMFTTQPQPQKTQMFTAKPAPAPFQPQQFKPVSAVPSPMIPTAPARVRTQPTPAPVPAPIPAAIPPTATTTTTPVKPNIMSPMHSSTAQFMAKPVAPSPQPGMFRPVQQMPMPVAQPMLVPTNPVTSSPAAPRAPQMVPTPPVARPPMSTFAPSPTVALSSARPKPERINTPLAAELQQVQLADSELAASIISLVDSLITALEQRSAGTPDERHVAETAVKLEELKEKISTLPSECAEAVLGFLKDVESKDGSSAQKNLAALTKNHSKSLSSNILTGLRFLQRLSVKLL